MKRKALHCPLCTLPARRERRYAPFCSATCAINYAKKAFEAHDNKIDPDALDELRIQGGS